MTFLQFSILENFKAGYYRECHLLLYSFKFLLQMNPNDSEIKKSMVAPALKTEVDNIDDTLNKMNTSSIFLYHNND